MRGGGGASPPLLLGGQGARSDDAWHSTPTAMAPPGGGGPTRDLKIWTGTWNVATRSPTAPASAAGSASLRRARANGGGGGGGGGAQYDVVAVGVQECSYKGDQGGAAWFAEVEDALGGEYTIVAKHSMSKGGSIRLLVAVRSSLAGAVSDVSVAAHGTGILSMLANKGAVGVSLSLCGVRFCFISCHLAAHMPEVARRNQDLRQLVCGLNLQLNLGLPDQPRPAVPLLHHHTFLLGDLNYRLQVTGRHCHHHQHHHHHSRQPPPHRLHLPRLQPPGAAKLTKSVKGREQLAFYDSVVGWARGGQWDRLLEHDQLLSATGLLDEWGGPDRHPLAAAAAAADPEKPVLSVSETRRATKFLFGWREGALQFAPTYSLLVGERLSYKPNRMPSYCDRILSYSAAGHDRQLALLSYASSDTLRSSDHAPVAAAYALTVADAHVPAGILSHPSTGALGPSTWRLQLVGLSARLASPPSAASAGSPLLPSSSGALSLFASACGPLFGRQAPCSAVVATERAAARRRATPRGGATTS